MYFSSILKNIFDYKINCVKRKIYLSQQDNNYIMEIIFNGLIFCCNKYLYLYRCQRF